LTDFFSTGKAPFFLKQQEGRWHPFRGIVSSVGEQVENQQPESEKGGDIAWSNVIESFAVGG
jgi:hypothetical protein